MIICTNDSDVKPRYLSNFHSIFAYSAELGAGDWENLVGDADPPPNWRIIYTHHPVSRQRNAAARLGLAARCNPLNFELFNYGYHHEVYSRISVLQKYFVNNLKSSNFRL
ncbi:hypothetical protein [Nostoc sp.]|uniref:hypothetical protein n=1 Tax=Nostoc sp. TaxID=1180 RepID=UPI002FF9F02B